MRTGTLAATFVGVVTLALAGCGGHAASKRPPSPVAFTVLSRYSAPWQDGLTLHVLAGAASATPHWGAVLIEYSRHRTGTYDVPPRMIATPTETGVLRISSTTPRGDVILRSVRSTYVLRWESEGPEPTLYDLGPPLDPAQLPGLAAAGVVADFTFDGGHRHAVLLVGNPVGAIPVLYGHLSGFTLAGPDTGTRMNAQIIGPDGRAYRIDIAAGKLVPEARRAIAPKREQRLVGGACTDWPAADGVSYRSCPQSIIREQSGVSKTLYRNPIWSESKGQAETNFVAVIPSPTGKWLLFQQSIWSCGSADNTYVMAAKGGPATGALSAEFSHTYALGWLGGHTALVGGDRTGECGGATSGLYVVDARYPSFNVPQLVGADPDIASTWGFGN